jgi:hypothetical protein
MVQGDMLQNFLDPIAKIWGMSNAAYPDSLSKGSKLKPEALKKKFKKKDYPAPKFPKCQ